MLLLKNVLKINAISSGATGLILVSLPGKVAAIVGAPETLPFILVGVFLIAFAIFVFEVSLQKPVKVRAVKTIIVLDTLWVIGSAIALIFLIPVLSLIGNALVIAVAMWVAFMAYLQRKALSEGFS